MDMPPLCHAVLHAEQNRGVSLLYHLKNNLSVLEFRFYLQSKGCVQIFYIQSSES